MSKSPLLRNYVKIPHANSVEICSQLWSPIGLVLHLQLGEGVQERRLQHGRHGRLGLLGEAMCWHVHPGEETEEVPDIIYQETLPGPGSRLPPPIPLEYQEGSVGRCSTNGCTCTVPKMGRAKKYVLEVGGQHNF